MTFKFLLVFLILGCACTSVPVRPQSKILLPRAPFIASFHKGPKVLIYVGAAHHSSIEFPIALEDPTFKTVTKAFKEGTPQGVVIEGVDPAYLATIPKSAEKCAAANYNVSGKMCDEGALTIVNAVRSGAALYTGEPSRKTIFSGFKNKGYSLQDFFAFTIINNIPPLKRHENLNHENFASKIEPVVKATQIELGSETSFSIDDFASWYKVHMPVPKDYLDINVNQTRPYNGPAASVMEKMSFVVTSIRDQNNVATIQNALAEHDRVLVVYGASHFEGELAALEEIIGTPTIDKPY